MYLFLYRMFKNCIDLTIKVTVFYSLLGNETYLLNKLNIYECTNLRLLDRLPNTVLTIILVLNIKLGFF